MEQRIKQLLHNSIDAKITIADVVPKLIAMAAQRLINCLLNDNKILLCGNGGSAANCMHFSTAMMNHFEIERPSLPIMNLTTDLALITAIANENHYNDIFAKQINTMAHEGDILLTLSTTGNSDSLLNAINAGNDRNMDIIALTGRDGGILANHLGPEDIEIRITIDNAARIREIHLFILHCFCDLIDQSLFKQILE